MDLVAVAVAITPKLDLSAPSSPSFRLCRFLATFLYFSQRSAAASSIPPDLSYPTLAGLVLILSAIVWPVPIAVQQLISLVVELLVLRLRDDLPFD